MRAFLLFIHSLFSDLRSLAGTTLLSLLATLFMSQLLFVIGVGGIQVGTVNTQNKTAKGSSKRQNDDNESLFLPTCSPL